MQHGTGKTGSRPGLARPADGRVRVIMTHDIDWPIKGPGKHHVLQRKERFDESVISRVIEQDYNPYYNVPDIMELEEKHAMRSTFFFRPAYDDGSPVDQYREVIRDLVGGGWEVGVHINDAGRPGTVKKEKAQVERAAGRAVDGSRVHYLKIRPADLSLLEKAGLKYDSSVSFSKDSLDKRNTGYLTVGKLFVFPITLMDAYVFTYMRVPEERVVELVGRALALAKDTGFMTVLWHDNSIKMKGGRMYGGILEFLASQDNVEVVKGIDAYRIIKNGSSAVG